MTRGAALGLIAALQLAFIVLTVMLLFVTRLRGRRFRARGREAELILAEPLQRIMLGDDGGESLAAALLTLRPDVATRELIAICGKRLSSEQRRALASLVRHDPWVERTLGQAFSGKWWKRLEAARLLVMVCDERDEKLVTRLVTDKHAAVASATTTAIGACATPSLIETVVQELPHRAPSVRLQQCDALRRHATLATDAVVRRLSQRATTQELRAWIQLAEVLGTPDALTAIVPFASHPDVEIRTGTARALRSCFSPAGAEAVTRLLQDGDWRVRAAAARAVGALNMLNAIPLLENALHDESWWVRFRAGLALAGLSKEGQSALVAAQQSQDPFARDMATLVCGLADGSRLDLTSA